MRLLSKPPRLRLERLPAGAFTMDNQGKVVATTLPQNFPRPLMEEIGRTVRTFFSGAPQQDHNPLTELVVHYGLLQLTARKLRDGAIVFLTPARLTKTDPCV